MDYLVCEENNAEVLQFFTWFCSYVVRWSELSPQEKLQSPPWKLKDRDSRSKSVLAVHIHRQAGSERLNRILEILDEKNAMDNINRLSDQTHKKVNSDPMNFSQPRRLSGTQTSQLQNVWGQSRTSTTPVEKEDAPGGEFVSLVSEMAPIPVRWLT